MQPASRAKQPEPRKTRAGSVITSCQPSSPVPPVPQPSLPQVQPSPLQVPQLELLPLPQAPPLLLPHEHGEWRPPLRRDRV